MDSLCVSVCLSLSLSQKRNEESESKKKRETNLVISHTPSADNSNLSADGDDSFISVEMDSAMPSPFSEVRRLRREQEEQEEEAQGLNLSDIWSLFHPLIPFVASFLPAPPLLPHTLPRFLSLLRRNPPPFFFLTHPQTACVCVCAPVRAQISLSSELQPSSLPPDADADESSSDMLVIVDEPVSSAPQSRATNSPASVSGSASDNMNGERKTSQIQPPPLRSPLIPDHHPDHSQKPNFLPSL